MGPPRAQWAPTETHWRVTTVTRGVDRLGGSGGGCVATRVRAFRRCFWGAGERALRQLCLLETGQMMPLAAHIVWLSGDKPLMSYCMCWVVGGGQRRGGYGCR
jgi:hypothetical protein